MSEVANQTKREVLRMIDDRLRRLISYDDSVLKVWSEDESAFIKSLFVASMQDLIQAYPKIRDEIYQNSLERTQMVAFHDMAKDRNSILFGFERFIERLPRIMSDYRALVLRSQREIMDLVKSEMHTEFHHLIRQSPEIVDRYFNIDRMSEMDLEAAMANLRDRIDDLKYAYLETTMTSRSIKGFMAKIKDAKRSGDAIQVDFTLDELESLSPEIYMVAKSDMLNRFFQMMFGKDVLLGLAYRDYHCEELISWGKTFGEKKIIFVEGATDYFKLRMLDAKADTKEFMKSQEYMEHLKLKMRERKASGREVTEKEVRSFLTQQQSAMLSKTLGIPFDVKTVTDISALMNSKTDSNTVQRMMNQLDGEWSVNDIKIDVTRHVRRLLPDLASMERADEFLISFSGKVFNRVGVST